MVFGQIVWYVAMPFDQKSEGLQLAINILADLALLAILLLPVVSNGPSFDSIYMMICLSLFGLAILSAILEIMMSLYCFIPYDLYEVGLTIVIEDKKLQKELQRRKVEQQ